MGTMCTKTTWNYVLGTAVLQEEASELQGPLRCHSGEIASYILSFNWIFASYFHIKMNQQKLPKYVPQKSGIKTDLNHYLLLQM